ncbi:MAG: hypothetical protein II683_02005 [Muribaculaceae bacterium]|nr:hypothetical protein [Muribaculaceae bacterium]
MNTPTLLQFANDEMLTRLLVKERAKCRRRNRNDKKHRLDRECDISTLSSRKMLSRLMPPRYSWVRPSKRDKLKNKSSDTCKIAEKALWMTIKRDRMLQKQEGNTFPYLEEMDAFFKTIRDKLQNNNINLTPPQLLPIYKSKEKMDDGRYRVTCRPLSVYNDLEDKILLALTSRYLKDKILERHLHPNILSYRKARTFLGEEHHVTDFNDGIRLIKQYLDEHGQNDIYVADCDIKKFYDIIPHSVVLDCFDRMLNNSGLLDEGKDQVMNVLKAYLNSYNFLTNAWNYAEASPQVYAKIRRKLHDPAGNNFYQLGWVDEIFDLPEHDQLHRGVPQGGSLSLIIANVVLNDVDQVIVSQEDNNRLFIRYCDDMILMHTSRDECTRLMNAYIQSLEEHGLYYHDIKRVSESKDLDNPTLTTSRFWKIKSHGTFLWGNGKGNGNCYIGFLGYELKRDGKMRLRKSNIQHFKEKLNRLYYSIRRYQNDKRHTDEEKDNHRTQSLNKAIDGVLFYEAFDEQQFRRGRQYNHLLWLKNKTERRLQHEMHNH